jgi:hypothetical protein
MQDQFISYNTAKLAKEKGFNISFHYVFLCEIDSKKGYDPSINIGHDYKVNEYPDERVGICTQSLLQKWLRDVHNINVFIKRGYGWEWYIESEGDGTYNTYEEALEEGLKEGLNKI